MKLCSTFELCSKTYESLNKSNTQTYLLNSVNVILRLRLDEYGVLNKRDSYWSNFDKWTNAHSYISDKTITVSTRVSEARGNRYESC
jgi:hypothetical protein